MKTKPKRIKKVKKITHHFTCEVDKELFEHANANRMATWPSLVEGMLMDMVDAPQARKKK